MKYETLRRRHTPETDIEKDALRQVAESTTTEGILMSDRTFHRIYLAACLVLTAGTWVLIAYVAIVF